MTRDEHLQWAKTRALAYVDAGDTRQAFDSFSSDLTKHDDLAGALKIQASLGMMQLLAGHLKTAREMRKWIDGFN